MEEQPKTWMDKKSIVIAWVVFFFPVGLYAVWKGQIFDQKAKLIITGIVLFTAFGVTSLGIHELRNSIFMFILCPVAIYFLWKDTSVKKTTTYIFCGVLVAFFAMYFSGGGVGGDIIDNCIAVQEQDGCTYFRDSNCVVISQVCG